MNSQTAVINVSGDYEETILRLSKHLGRDKTRRAVFDVIYGRGSKPLSKKQIAQRLGKENNGQIVQNSLDHLAKHHLILRSENKGQVNDGSRWVYAKEASIRANRDKIVRYADDPVAAKKVPTKRRPSTEVTLTLIKPATSRRQTRSRPRNQRGGTARLKIALLVTNPDRQASLQTGIEARDIDKAIRLSGRSSEVELKIVLAPTVATLLDMLNSYDPDVIHFSGHGGGGALVFDNEKAGDNGGTVLDFDLIARVVLATNAKPKLLVLAACDTVDGADRFLDAVPTVIAMSDSIDDEAACEFSSQFYGSLSAGVSICKSLEQAKMLLESKGYKDFDLPTLLASDQSVASSSLL